MSRASSLMPKALQADASPPAEGDSADPGATMTRRIAEAITAAIVERRLMPGTKLAEQPIADIFKVSRTIVRQALMQLSRDRLITLEPARGAFVSRPSVEEARAHDWSEQDLDQRRINRSRHVIGGPAKVQGQINVRAAEAGVTEVMVLSMIHDHAARRRSYELLTP